MHQEPLIEGPGFAAGQLCRTANVVRRHFEGAVLRHEDLRWTGFDLLQLLRRRRVVETGAAAEILGVPKTTLIGHVADLSNRGLIQRVPHATDRRRTVLRLTDAGCEMAQRTHCAVEAEETRMLDDGKPLFPANALRRLVNHGTAETATGGPHALPAQPAL
ncbi:MarR family winged helix-turn-helix transcriptional regulator [Plantactinospora sp. CA-290183]|uniref:MarR family winged helix-turn-helix transcriptional regulator n=1 Tax=Plantactinospora sp. CA-290183 TaxID=3240006 RepID=UPI003D8CC32C